jgi:putative MATE family efflux protein
LREALAGSHQDFTAAPLGRAIFLLALPMVLEMAMESLFTIVDVLWVARLGADAVATVGLTESMISLVFAVAIGLSAAAAAMVARRIGERDPAGAGSAAVQALGLGLLVSLPLGGLGATLAPLALRAMGASPAISAHASFTRVMLGGNATILLLFLTNGIFRGAGDAAIAMRALWLANLINLILDPCLIFGLGPFPKLGLVGAAVATTIGRGVGVAYQVAVLLRGRGRVAIARHQLRLDPAVMRRLARLSTGGMLQALISTSSWLGLVRILAQFGNIALAGYTIAIRIIVFAILPSWGLSNAAATLVGQNLGAARPDRAARSVWLTGACNMVFLAAIAVVFVALAGPIVGLFTRERAVAEVAASALRIISYGYVFYAWGMVMVQAFNGAGDTFTPTLINIGCFWLWQIPLAYTLAGPFGLGAGGVFWAIAVAYSTSAVVGIVLFRRGGWQRRTV